MSTCGYCGEAPADPGYDRCTACRTWRDEEWCEDNNHPHGEEPS